MFVLYICSVILTLITVVAQLYMVYIFTLGDIFSVVAFAVLLFVLIVNVIVLCGVLENFRYNYKDYIIYKK